MQDLAATFSPRFPFFSLSADQRANAVTSSNRFFAHRSGLRTASRQATFLRRGLFRFLAESDLLSRGSRFCCLKQKVGKHVPSGRLRKINAPTPCLSAMRIIVEQPAHSQSRTLRSKCLCLASTHSSPAHPSSFSTAPRLLFLLFD